MYKRQVLGLLPQCGFSAMAANLYASKVVTLGTLLAVFLATSDEAVPLLIANQMCIRDRPYIASIRARWRRQGPPATEI